MKKSKILICLLLFVFALTACGGNNDENIENSTTAAQIVATTESETVFTETTVLTTTEITQTTLPVSETSTAVGPSVTTTQRTTDKTTTTKTSTTKETTTKVPVIIHSTTKTTTTKATTTKSATAKQTSTKPTTTKVSTTKPTEPDRKPTTTKPTTETITTRAKNYCTVRIECKTIYNNLNKFENSKKSFLTSSGIILNDVQVELYGGESAFDVIKKACQENVCTDSCKYCEAGGVQLEYTYTPAFNNYYIEGIHQIYEKDCGTQSGWMYSINGTFPDAGSSSYIVSPGDTVVFAFTCNMGEDIGNTY